MELQGMESHVESPGTLIPLYEVVQGVCGIVGNHELVKHIYSHTLTALEECSCPVKVHYIDTNGLGTLVPYSTVEGALIFSMHTATMPGCRRYDELIRRRLRRVCENDSRWPHLIEYWMPASHHRKYMCLDCGSAIEEMLHSQYLLAAVNGHPRPRAVGVINVQEEFDRVSPGFEWERLLPILVKLAAKHLDTHLHFIWNNTTNQCDFLCAPGEAIFVLGLAWQDCPDFRYRIVCFAERHNSAINLAICRRLPIVTTLVPGS